MRELLYIVGVPGSGKTTLMRELVLGRRRAVVTTPFAHTVYEDGLVQLGRDRGTHGGTDALSMSVQPLVVAALETGVWPRVIAEGDRLANASFFEAVERAGYNLTVVVLQLPSELAAERRVARGTNQDERWLRGRESKVANLLKLPGLRGALLLPADRPVKDLAAALADHPVIRAE